MDDVDDYLQDGFDPSTITVPRLRSILVTHNVNYPATAKKQRLIDLFNEHVAPKAPRILEEKAKLRRTSKGIVNADEPPPLPPPERAPRRSRSPRKASGRPKDEEPDGAGISKVRVSRSISQVSDAESAVTADRARRTRRTLTPIIKSEDGSEPELLHPSVEEESVFSSDNPFQSGSSPPVSSRPSSSRRKTTGADPVESTLATEPRRRTEGNLDESRRSKSFPVPIRRTTPSLSAPPELEPGEEFTPEEQLELELENTERANRELARVIRPSRRKLHLGTPISVLLLTLLGAYLAWYRQEKIAVGYCGIGRPNTQILPPDIPIPEWVVPVITPQCEPCPPHAFCYSDYTVACESDFVLKPHPFALGGLVPLPPSCEPDGEKVRKVKAVADRAIEELRERRARFECGDLLDENGKREPSPALEESRLKEAVASKRSKRLSKQEFDDLWAVAIGEVKARDEIEVVDE